MKLILSTLVIIFTTVVFAQDKKSKVVETDIKTDIHCDHCIVCGSCGPNIFHSLKAEKGVKKVKIIPESNIIKVKYNSEKITLARIEDVITEAGFDANDKKATKEGYDALDACCKPSN